MFYVGLALLLGSVDVSLAQQSITYRCDQIPKAFADYKTIAHFHSYYIYRTISPLHNCAKVNYIYNEGRSNYDVGRATVIQGNSTFSYRLDFTNSTHSESVLSVDGSNIVYHAIYYNMDSRNASFCLANCDDDGINYKDVSCLGRTPEDEANIQRFLDTNLKGVQGIRDSHTGCQKSKNWDLDVN